MGKSFARETLDQVREKLAMTHDNDLIRRGDVQSKIDNFLMTKTALSVDLVLDAKESIAAIPAVAASQTADPVINAGSRQRVTVKPLDLSNLLKHAFVFGWKKSESTSSPMEYVWTEYDPTENAAYARILAAINMQPGSRDAQIAALVEALEAYKGREKRIPFNVAWTQRT